MIHQAQLPPERSPSLLGRDIYSGKIVDTVNSSDLGFSGLLKAIGMQ